MLFECVLQKFTMESEEYKTGSADSENGSDNSYVQVSREDAQQMMDSPVPPTDSPQLISGSGMSPVEELQDKDTTVYEDAEQEPVCLESVV